MAGKFLPRSLIYKPKKALTPRIKKAKYEESCPKSLGSDSVVQNDNFIDASDKNITESVNLKNCLLFEELKKASTPVSSCVEDKPENKDDDEVVYFSKNQRWPEDGEPVCVICGRYGEYICDQTEDDVCSKECKAKNLHDQKKTKDITLGIMNKVNKPNIVQNYETLTIHKPYTYTRHPIVESLSESQVCELRARTEITVKGDNVERPVLEFSHCNINEKILENLTTFGYKTPTPVQMQVIPVALSGCGVLVCAQTGYVKTAAFLVAIMVKI